MPCTTARQEMVDIQIAARGIRDQKVLDAMRRVPRERFVGEDLQQHAYADNPLPIGAGQTISQPYIVACMIEALQLHGPERVLEIGTGSGYAAAILAEIAAEVYTIERIASLADSARDTLRHLGYSNVEVLHADGTRGWPDKAPFDAIVVAAAGPSVPESLKLQLARGGRLVIPVGSTPRQQRLVRVVRTADDQWETTTITGVRFVPLIGEEGWAQTNSPD